MPCCSSWASVSVASFQGMYNVSGVEGNKSYNWDHFLGNIPGKSPKEISEGKKLNLRDYGNFVVTSFPTLDKYYLFFF